VDQSAQSPIDEVAAVKGVMLRNAWYYALPSAELVARKAVHRTLLGEPVLIGRDAAGRVFALRDTCPHRGTLLSRGSFDGREVECPYHGWRFGTDGQCTAIPSQTAEQRPQPSDIRATVYPVRESQGNIWVFIGARDAVLPPTPEIPKIGNGQPQLHVVLRFPFNIDLAVIGLMDPAHGAFVHASALWRNRRSVHEKRKSFSPLVGQLGWRMDRHKASSNSRASRLFLGGQPETEITYSMPSVRIEHATTGRYSYAGLTACTPVTADVTDVHHVMYWDVPLAPLWRPLVRPVATRFLDQDRRAVLAMQEGLAFAPPTMLVRDADTQVRWYYRLKREWLAAQAEDRPPYNPITATVLSWRS
jgi:phenylpropionate dioxygenase-like ring-hydroxylating dioxygenase large terminal subunit